MGNIIVALSEINRLCGEIFTPLSIKLVISFLRADKSRTTPLPIIEILSSRKMPDGKIFNLYVSLLITRVWPAL